MSVTNDETTGASSWCRACGLAIEEGLLLKGLRLSSGERSAGVPTWRRLDRGPGAAVCPSSPSRIHVPGASASGSAFQA